MQAPRGSPGTQRQPWIVAQRARQQIGPILDGARAWSRRGRQQARDRAFVALRRTRHGIGIRHAPEHRSVPPRRKRDHQDIRTRVIEAVDVALERPVDEHVARLDAMTAGVAGFGIAAGQHDGGEAVRMLMARQDFVRRVVRAIHAAVGEMRSRRASSTPLW